MSFDYNWTNKEANFGPPIPKQVDGGTHITFEIILKKDGKYIALRRPNAIPGHELPPQTKNSPEGLLYFCHNLIRYGELVEDCIERIVREQAGVAVKSYQIVDISSELQGKDGQWSFMPYVIAELETIPETNELVTEVVIFDESTIPDNFGWWTKEELAEFLVQFTMP